MSERTPGECVTLGGHVYEGGACYHCGKQAPPGPPSPPRCRECRGPHGSKSWMPRHTPECSIGQELHRRGEVSRQVTDALTKAVQAKYKDVEFMDRLHRNIERHGVLLARLADDEDDHHPFDAREYGDGG